MDDLFEHMMARDQDRAITGFYYHFIAFAVVIAILTIVNIVTSDEFWIHWVVLGWGLGLGLHAYLVFVKKPARTRKLIARRQARLAPVPDPDPIPELPESGQPPTTPDTIP